MKYAYDYAPFTSNKAKMEKLGVAYGETDYYPLKGSVLLHSAPCRDKVQTADCKAVLVEYATESGEASMQKASDWKRVWKKTYDFSEYHSASYRGFESKSTGKVLTVMFLNGHICVLDFNLKDSFDEIDQIMKLAKKHYVGVDCTSVLYNPVTKVVWLPTSDSGSFTVDDVAKVDLEDEDWIEEKLDDEDNGFEAKYYPENALDFVTDSVDSDEFEPELCNGFIPIGYYSDYA